MKAWQVLLIGVAILTAGLLLPLYESVLAGLGAILVLGAVAGGFMFPPRRDVFYVRTTREMQDIDQNLLTEHELLAVRVELARLWLLFIPAFVAVAFLVVTAASGRLWHIKLLDLLEDMKDTPDSMMFFIVRLTLIVVISCLSAWISERTTLRDAEASSLHYAYVRGARVSYSFLDCNGEYYGGEGLRLLCYQPLVLETLVFYNIRRPELNKIATSLLFHRLVIIGRGLTELDHQAVAEGSKLATNAV